MLISHKGHTDSKQVYSVTVMTHVKALQARHSSQGISEPITTEPPVLDKLVQLLTEKAATRKPVSPAPAEPTKLETRLQTFFEGRQIPNQQFRPRPVRRDWSEVKCFSCGKSGHSATRCPTFDETFPFILPGWKSEKTSTGYVMVSPRMAMDRRRAENEN